MTVIRGAPRHVAGTPTLVASAPSFSEGWQECPPQVWYSPEIDASKFTLHILSDTPGGFQWLKYILLTLCNATRCLGNRKHIILSQRVRGSVRAVRAVQNTRVFLMETRVVADGTYLLSVEIKRLVDQWTGTFVQFLYSYDDFDHFNRYDGRLELQLSRYPACQIKHILQTIWAARRNGQ